MSREKAQRMYDEDPLLFAHEASDYGWSVITGMCGGCGTEECHEGPCESVGVFGHCRFCPTRKAQGTVPAGAGLSKPSREGQADE